MKTLLLVISVIWFVSLPATSNAQLASFAGRWKNVNSAARNLTKIQIDVDPTVSVQAFGSCHPKDCEWGMVTALAYAPAVDDSLAAKAKAITAQYDFGFSEVRIVIQRLGGHRIKVETFTHFKDGSGRTDYYHADTMRPLRKNETF
jgi:hypothetical protein